MVEDVLIGLAHRMTQQLVAHRTPVDEKELQIRLAAGECRLANPAGEMQPGGTVIQINRLRGDKGSCTD